MVCIYTLHQKNCLTVLSALNPQKIYSNNPWNHPNSLLCQCISLLLEHNEMVENKTNLWVLTLKNLSAGTTQCASASY